MRAQERAMQVKDVMVTDVKTIGPAATVQEAAKAMRQFGIGSLIVTEADALKGIITDGDVLRKVVAEGKDGAKTAVREVMTKEIVMVEPEMDLQDAVDVMMEKRIKKLPVVKGSALVGIVTVTDICRVEPRMAEQIGELVFSSASQKRVAG